MLKADVLTLIAETPAAHGVFDEYEPAERTVFCTVRSASYTDRLAAQSEGFVPELVFRLSHDFEYQGEKLCRFHGVEYRIDRAYYGETDWIELTCSRRNADV